MLNQDSKKFFVVEILSNINPFYIYKLPDYAYFKTNNQISTVFDAV